METNQPGTPGQNPNGQPNTRHRDDEFVNEETVHNAEEKDIEERKQDRQHHQEHGNRKYESFTNHSSADDMPTTDTGA